MQTEPLAAGNRPAASDRYFDVVVMGAGVAGLSFALRLPPTWRIALLTKGVLGESNTRYAQGGISAAIGESDSPALHAQDTLFAGAGLSDASAVTRLAEAGPDAVDWLLSLGAHFDRNPETGQIELGREAAHSRHRVLHAGGDATGAEVERTLVEAVKQRQNVVVHDNAFALDLVVENGECAGLLASIPGNAGLMRMIAPVTVIAAGGAGQLWETTSNPPGATGDGLAMAIRAGVTIADTEFVQFHPTVLKTADGAPFLVTEAVRGEGAYLRDSKGQRFMVDEHELAELAPRDVVARGIQTAMVRENSDHVFLDLSHLDRDQMLRRFPTIAGELNRRGLNLTTDLIPVAPAAHYFIGGLASGPDGATSLPGLLSLGEAACSGVHGANRLASNSLLEGLVFGTSAAEAIVNNRPLSSSSTRQREASGEGAQSANTTEESGAAVFVTECVRHLQQSMSLNVGVVRNATGLQEAEQTARTIHDRLGAVETSSIELWQAQNMTLAAMSVITAALHREESRGAHFRSDFPETLSSLDGEDSILDTPSNAFADWRYDQIHHVLAKATENALLRDPVKSG